MDTIDTSIKKYLEKKAMLLPGGRGLNVYPASEDFYLFLSDELRGEALERMLKHLKDHPEDRDFVAQTRRILEEAGDSEKRNVPERLIRQAKDLHGASKDALCPHCGKPVTPFKRPLGRQKTFNILWFAAASLCFVLSFVFRHYFYQFLTLTALAGFKAIIDQKATKTQILIYKALHEGPEEKERDLHRLSSHL